MEKSHFRILLPLLAGLSLISGAVLVYLLFVYRPVTAASLRDNGFFVYDTPPGVSDFSLIDAHEKPFTKANFNSKWTLVFFGYTFCPDICPITMATIKQFYDLLGEAGEAGDVQVVMISVDPMRDTPQVMADYVGYFDPDFIGVTGEYARIYKLASQMHVAFSYQRLDGDNYLINHNGEILLMDPRGENYGFFKGPHEPQKMLQNFLAVRKLWRRTHD